MSNAIYLYIKTHNITGLKYFGKTVSDPNIYKGSGKYWKKHLSKHGNDVTTEIFGTFNLDNIEQAAIKFSKENNIVNSDDWANLKEENGLDGGSKSEYHTVESRAKMSRNRRGIASWTGLTHSLETKVQMSEKAKIRCARDGAPSGAWKAGHKSTVVYKRTPEIINKLKDSLKNQKQYTCPHCSKSMYAGNYTRWHGDKCKNKKENNNDR